MFRFRDMPIKQKLMLAIMVSMSAGLLLAGIGIVLADSYLFRRYLERDLSALAKIVADNTTASLAFDDSHSAGETLAALRARPHVAAACVYRSDGTTLAKYVRPGRPVVCPSGAWPFEIRSSGDALLISQPIVLRNRRIGTLVIRYDLEEINERIGLYSASVFGVLLVVSLVALLVSLRLRAILAAPILKLMSAATSVSRTKDYNIRAQKLSGDELGVLVDAFNEMLAGIQSRDSELREALIDREHALQEAQTAREFLETTLASIGDAVISTDLQGHIVFANPVAQSLVGWSGEELVGRRLDDVFRIVNEFSRAKVESPVSKVLREGTIVGMANHTVLIARDGTEIPIDDSGAPIRDADGAIQGTVLVFRDVTARRRADAVTRLLASIVESSGDAIIGHDLNGSITSWNRGAERIFGYSAEEAIGQTTALISDLKFPDEMPDMLKRIEKGESIEQYQSTRRKKSGETVDVSIKISPIYNEFGRVVGASKIGRDTTEQMLSARRLAHANSALKRSNDNLARSNEDLERFAFVASHDLQEPLRMITVYSQLLLREFTGEPGDDAKMFMEYIAGGTKRMRELLADLLAYSEIGSRQDEPTSPVDLNVLVEEVKQNLKASIDDTGAAVSTDRLPTVNAHLGHLVSLFQNLIGNAIKYRSAEPPQIRISVQAEAGHWRFAVADNGIGIQPEYKESIFVPFKRLHGKSIPGTGIGLAICQRVIERYGGRIWVESEFGHGAEFIFTLPDASLARKEK